MKSGPASGSGTVAGGGGDIHFSTFSLLACELVPFTATVSDDNLTADIAGAAATPPTCTLLTGHLQLHRTG
jgi:hypothetical protein